MSSYGHNIVLTSEAAIASDTLGSSLIGFISALPDNILRGRIANFLFRVDSYKDGVAKKAPYGLAKVEAKLKSLGYDVVIASPYALDKLIGPNTKVVGIYTMDGMGYSYGSGITYWMLKLAGIKYNGLPFIARSFHNVLKALNSSPFRKNFKVIVGGPAAWQVYDSGMQQELGVDYVFEGEFEKDGPEFIKKVIQGASLPPRFVSKPASISDIVPIVTPSNGGLVEVTRGCGRGCAFCTPNLSGMIRSIPFDLIEKEIEVNIKVGKAKDINLHSEEFFRYGAKGIDPDPDKVIKLTEMAYRLVKSFNRDYNISIDFTTAAVVVQEPGLVKKVGEYVNEGGRKTFIEMGIETASARLLERYMKGKVLPYRPIQYPEIVTEAIGILNDNGWIVVGTMIVNFPEESDDDIIANIELIDRLKNLKVVTFPLPLVPVAAFRKKGFTALDEMLDDPLRREFILRALLKAFDSLKETTKMVMEGVDNPIVRVMLQRFGLFALNTIKKRYEDELSRTLAARGKEVVKQLAQ